MNILEYLQSAGVHGRNHSLDFLLAAYDITMQQRTPDCNEVIISFKDIVKWIASHGSSISTVTYQSRKDDLAEMGLLIKCRRKRGSGEDIKLSKKGLKIAEIMKKFVDNVTQAYIEKQAISMPQPLP